MLSHLLNIDIDLLLFFNGNGSPFFDDIALTLTSTITWVPLFITLFYVVVKNNETMAQIGLVVASVALCLVLTSGVDNLVVKPMVGRLRPLNDPDVAPLLYIQPGLFTKTFSFFSAHAANTFGIAVFFSLLLRNLRVAWALIVWSLVNCWTRMYLGMHFPSDILVGILWGILSALLAYLFYFMLYRRLTAKLHFISSQYTSTGYFLADVSLIVNIFLLTLLYSVFHALITL